MSGLDETIEQISQTHGGHYSAAYDDRSHVWVATIETDDWFVRGEGATEDLAKGDLVRDAKEQGRA